MPRWCSSAPLGNPVVPDVYWICAGSPGATEGSVNASSDKARNCAQSVKLTVSRSSGALPLAVRTASAMSKPRYSGVKKIPAARDCCRT